MFNFSYDKRVLYVILAILAIMMLTRMGSESLTGILYSLPGVIVAITFHEFAHAYAAYKLGDDTARMQGRLNLNPLSHIDPVGFVLLIFAGIGWGKPVQINPRNFDRKYSESAGEAIVSVAGPFMNFLLAIVFALVYCVVYKLTYPFFYTTAGSIIERIIVSAVVVNVGLGLFNLIPLPPLDGSKIFRNFMSYNVKQWLDKYERVFYIIFLFIWISGLAGEIIAPAIVGISNGLLKLIGMPFGITFI